MSAQDRSEALGQFLAAAKFGTVTATHVVTDALTLAGMYMLYLASHELAFSFISPTHDATDTCVLPMSDASAVTSRHSPVHCTQTMALVLS